MKEIMERMNYKEWLILPGLRKTYFRFLSAIEKYFDPKNEADSFSKPIILIGDTGCGKSLFIEAARQTFENLNPTKATLYSRINCAALSNELVGSEIFGHVKGSFTNAHKDKPGIVESIDTGLLVLDEIGETTEEIQAKLLVFVEDGEYRRVGDNKTRKSRVKIIGTTNKQQDKFRPDFWYRFYPIFIPPLYERRYDVLYYLSIKHPEIMKRLTPAHVTSLLSYNWPGNIREIDRVISIMEFEESESGICKDNPLANILPMKFPEDPRQTNLATIYSPKFGDDLQRKGIDVNKINKHMAGFGLKIQKSFYEEVSKPIRKKNRNTSSIMFDIRQDAQDKPESSQKYTSIIQIATSFEVDDSADLFEKNDTTHYQELVSNMRSQKENTNLVNIKLIKRSNSIFHIYLAFKGLCKLFFKSVNLNDDILSIQTKPHVDYDIDTDVEKHILLEFIKNGIAEDIVNILYKDYVGENKCKPHMPWVKYANRLFAENVLKNNDQVVLDELFSSSTERQLLSKYYLYLISNNKTLKLVAPAAGLKYETLRSKLKKLRINHAEIE